MMIFHKNRLTLISDLNVFVLQHVDIFKTLITVFFCVSVPTDVGARSVLLLRGGHIHAAQPEL